MGKASVKSGVKHASPIGEPIGGRVTVYSMS